MAEVIAVSWRLMLGFSLVYVLLAVAAHYYSLQRIFLHPPVKYTLTPDYIRLTAPDGVALAAHHWPNPTAKYTLLYLHGNYEDLGSIGEYLPKFVEAGYAVFAIDYRGYGHSGGSSDEASTYADTAMAYEYLRTKLGVPAERIILFGYSLGSGPAVELALSRPAAGLVLQSAFVSTYRVMTRYPLFPGDKFVNIRKIPRVKMPVFYLHGTEDRTAPHWHGEALYAATTARKMKFIIEGGRHGGLAEFAGPRYWQELNAFTDSL